ncbi:MAG: hypothetical protein ACOYJA_10825 [Christensenellales bacterium]
MRTDKRTLCARLRFVDAPMGAVELLRAGRCGRPGGHGPLNR